MRERVCVALGLLLQSALLASVVFLVTTTIECFRASRSPAPAPSFLTPAAAATLMYIQPVVGLPAQSSGPEPVRLPRRGAGRYREWPASWRDKPTARPGRGLRRDSAHPGYLNPTRLPAGPDGGDAAETRPGQPDALAPHLGRGPKDKRQAEMQWTYRKGPPPPRHLENRWQLQRLPHSVRGPDDARSPEGHDFLGPEAQYLGRKEVRG